MKKHPNSLHKRTKIQIQKRKKHESKAHKQRKYICRYYKQTQKYENQKPKNKSENKNQIILSNK